MLAINNWDEKYENSRTKQFKTLTWVPVPNKYDDDDVLDLLELEDGLEIFGIFILLLELASKNTPRGIICTGDVQEMYNKTARKLRIPQDKMQRALEVLANEPFNWLVDSPCTGHVHGMYSELNRIEQNSINPPIVPPSGGVKEEITQKIQDIYLAYPKQTNETKALWAIAKAIKIIDPDQLLAKVKEYSIKSDWKEMRFIPDCHKWMNDKRWNDDPKTWEEGKEKNKQYKAEDYKEGF